MRHAQGGGVDAKARALREAVRMQAAEMFTAGVSPEEILVLPWKCSRPSAAGRPSLTSGARAAQPGAAVSSPGGWRSRHKHGRVLIRTGF